MGDAQSDDSSHFLGGGPKYLYQTHGVISAWPADGALPSIVFPPYLHTAEKISSRVLISLLSRSRALLPGIPSCTRERLGTMVADLGSMASSAYLLILESYRCSMRLVL
jgi:hypothetical protein